MNIFLLLIITFAGSYGTYENCRKYNLSPVLVSSLMGLLSSLIFLVQNFKEPFLLNAFFGATFIGMSSAKKFSRVDITIASVVFVFLYIKLIPYLNGIGGALGFSAFISVVFSFILTSSIKFLRFNPKN